MALRQLYPPKQAQIPAPSADLKSGEVIIHTVLGPCIAQGLFLDGRISVGSPIAVEHELGRVVVMDAANADTFAEGADVHTVDGESAVPVGTGTKIGVAFEAKAAGTTEVKILFGA